MNRDQHLNRLKEIKSRRQSAYDMWNFWYQKAIEGEINKKMLDLAMQLCLNADKMFVKEAEEMRKLRLDAHLEDY